MEFEEEVLDDNVEYLTEGEQSSDNEDYISICSELGN